MKALLKKIEKFNCWDDKIFDTGYERTNYLEKLINYLDNRLIKVLVGQRRVGKSYILRQIISFLRNTKKVNHKNIFYLNKEYLAFDAIKSASDLEDIFEFYKKELKVKGKIYIFIDEIQNINNWEKFVNSYSQDYTEEYEIFITGSNSNLLSGELSSLLSGRYIEFEIFSFDLSEYANFNKLELNKSTFLQYVKTSGLPEMFNFKQEEIQRNYIASLKNTIILRDIISRHSIKDVDLLENIFKFIMNNIGSLSSFSSIVKYFKSKQKKTNYETLSTYVGYLKSTFIIHEAERFNLRGKQILGAERKYYINDFAFKNYLLGFYPDDIGHYLENFVYLQLRRLEYMVTVGVLGDKEIDFVAQKADKTVYIQVAYLLIEHRTIEREFGNLLSISDNFDKFVVSLDDTRFSNYKGIKHLRPWELVDFL